MINLLEASHPNKNSPICTFVLHLVELTGRASAMLIVHNAQTHGRRALDRNQAQSDNIITAFEAFESNVGYVSVHPLTAISPYPTMHEDICAVAEEKRVAIIIIPFHKQQTVDGTMEPTNPAYRMINQSVLTNAPCSVGILVDRGLTGQTRLSMNQPTHHVAVLFFGGVDDREALMYGWRMSQHQGINLTVIRFVPGHQASQIIMGDVGKEKELDDELVRDFRDETVNEDSVNYTEEVVNHGAETVAAIRAMEAVHDLVVVGKGQGELSGLTAGLTDWSECPELGTIGDLLASSDFVATYSVLVIQQFVGGSEDFGETVIVSQESENQESKETSTESGQLRTSSVRD